MIIRITDLKKRTKFESFYDKKFNVISRSGLHATEKALIEKLSENKNPKKILILENRTGVSAIIAKTMFPESEVVVQNIDLFHTNKIKRNLKGNNFSKVSVKCKAHIEEENVDIVMLQLAGQIHKELVYELIQEASKALKRSGKLMIASDASIKWMHKHILSIFNSATYIKEKFSQLHIIKMKEELKHYVSYETEFTMLLDGEVLPMSSLPGTFAHRRIDEGAMAILDVVETEPNQKVLDMGCGIGTIGIGMAHREPTLKIDFLDANSRAIASTKKNCELNNIENANFILQEDGVDEKDKYDIYVGNPPYFTNYKIASLFVDSAKDCVVKGGKVYIVAKNIDSLKSIFGERFMKMEVKSSRGYFVLIGIK